MADLLSKLQSPRAIWLMLPAGAITEAAVHQLGELCDAGDIVIDGGNSMFKDDVRRAKALRRQGIHYVDVGTSGGVWGIERGYCLMIGGSPESVAHLDPIFKALAPSAGVFLARLDANTSPAQQKRAISIVARPALDIS